MHRYKKKGTRNDIEVLGEVFCPCATCHRELTADSFAAEDKQTVLCEKFPTLRPLGKLD